MCKKISKSAVQRDGLVFATQPYNSAKECIKMTWMWISVVLFLLAAGGGLYLATQHFQRNDAPFSIAILHGVLAVAGLAFFLIGLASIGTTNLWTWSVVLFVVAAIGGLVLVSMHAQRRPLPRPVIVFHGLLAIIAWLLLLYPLLSSR